MKGLSAFVFSGALALALSCCAGAPSTGSKRTSFAKEGGSTTKGQVTQAELQDDLLRFESQFNARIEGASQALEASDNSHIRYRAALNRLVYGSNSLNIVLGPSPESNLLDMVTFIELSRSVLEKHWIPDLFGKPGQPLEQAFAESSQQIWIIAEKVLDAHQRDLLKTVISTWRQKHPDQINVETVRLSAFSTEAGAKAAGLDQNVGGLFASLEQSTQAVDSARLFSERALYYAERAPFLFRLQARLGAYEIVNDTGVSLAQLPGRGLLKEFRETFLAAQAALVDADATTQSVKALFDQMAENPTSGEIATASLNQLTLMLKEWGKVLASSSKRTGPLQAAGIVGQVDQQSNLWLDKAAWLGFSLIAFFWVMYVLAKLTCHYFIEERKKEKREKR